MEHVLVTGGHGDLGNRIASSFREGEFTVHAPGRDQLDVADAGSVASFFKTLPTLWIEVILEENFLRKVGTELTCRRIKLQIALL